MIKYVNSLADLKAQISGWQQNGYKIGLVPTMGSLHEGHLSLISLARENCDKVVTSIYVNPQQFSQTEDFDSYPRTLSHDLEKLSELRVCDLVFNPTQMYHENHATIIAPTGVAEPLEGQIRPHFFGGVATIIIKLFNQIKPDIAIFGEKDYQQLLVIKQLMRDLDLPVQIIAGQTFRETDGLAMSSRNSYLSDSERKIAANIYRVMQIAAENLQSGIEVSKAIQNAINELARVGITKIDYFSLRDPITLEPLSTFKKDARLLVALYVGATRLIDNIAVSFVQSGTINSEYNRQGKPNL
jgi:pantoate--beta-alanine ligase